MKFLKYILLLLAIQLQAQNFINENEFDNYIKKNDVFVIEFWAEWNKENQCNFLKDLNQCNATRVCIVANKKLKERFEVEVLPTLILIHKGQEVCRFNGNLLFQLTTKKSEVQTKIDSIIISKFN
tara:strand:+ start:805 stop:1179 length:375 start_codon:yes stop_codon:yes gene_type:complete